jgi:hypothetical protein
MFYRYVFYETGGAKAPTGILLNKRQGAIEFKKKKR